LLFSYLTTAIGLIHAKLFIEIIENSYVTSVDRLQEFLSCYGPTKEPLALGERYGFRLFDHDVGYNYLTGGGGMVLNRGAVELLSKDCKCPSIDYPDDMYIMGLCLSKLRIPILHSSLFHQVT
jgi:UDP-glucose:O-linked fucose beta-1,3-glucosyltransferase